MEPKTIEERITALEEIHKMDANDVDKAKKKGSFFGDPIVIIE